MKRYFLGILNVCVEFPVHLIWMRSKQEKLPGIFSIKLFLLIRILINLNQGCQIYSLWAGFSPWSHMICLIGLKVCPKPFQNEKSFVLIFVFRSRVSNSFGPTRRWGFMGWSVIWIRLCYGQSKREPHGVHALCWLTVPHAAPTVLGHNAPHALQVPEWNQSMQHMVLGLDPTLQALHVAQEASTGYALHANWLWFVIVHNCLTLSLYCSEKSLFGWRNCGVGDRVAQSFGH